MRMSQIPKFGFSAYLKLLNANPKPRKSIIRNRYKPSSGGYDFHKSLRQRVQQIAFGGLSVQSAIASTQSITKPSERISAKKALERFEVWKGGNPGSLHAAKPMVFPSPGGLFRVEFTPNFMMEIDGRLTAVHIWNTRHALAGNLTRAALCSVASRFPVDDRPDDVAVLSLQDGSFFRWSEADKNLAALGERLLQLLDLEFATARIEFGLPAITIRDAPTPDL
jgi:hypothetical protein